MRKTLTQVRCVPRFGFENTDVRIIEIDIADLDHDSLSETLQRWFAMRGIGDAVYAIETDDDGYFAIINDEAYEAAWGQPLI